MTTADTPTVWGCINASTATTIEDVAIDVMAALKLSKAQRHALHYLIRDEVRRTWRGHVRTVERSVSGGSGGEDVDRVAFLGERFVLADGRFVRWGSATVDDHLARIALLETLRCGLAQTIARHQAAIAEITTASVVCLDDVASTSRNKAA